MTSTSSNVRSQPSRKRFEISPKQREQLANLLVERLPNTFDRILQWLSHRQLLLLIVSLILLLTPLITARPAIWQQGVVAALLIAMGRLSLQMEEQKPSKKTSEYLHLFLILLSIVTTLRYLYYRVSYTLNFDDWLNGTFCFLLLVAELYAIATLILAYFQTLKIKDRKPVDLSLYPQDKWFKVDIYIPTYNEDVEIVRKTTLAALAIEYPADKKRVYVLDDGRAEKYKARREELRQMCEELGATMLVRDNNDHAKAGNINTAFKHTDGDLVLILDCDHMPVKDFLMHTVGFFFNPKVAFVQTPHWFYNPDPFERNLLTNGKIPVGNELFYKVLQKGNDFWNAAFFCGSAAVIRKEYALQIGGIATETVTEDCHTAFRLHSLGYESVYYDKIMVAGLAPEKFSAYVGQQVRWGKGYGPDSAARKSPDQPETAFDDSSADLLFQCDIALFLRLSPVDVCDRSSSIFIIWHQLCSGSGARNVVLRACLILFCRCRRTTFPTSMSVSPSGMKFLNLRCHSKQELLLFLL
jgi:cellulose synthase (UDP-forming)